MPSEPAVVKIGEGLKGEESHWILGGRDRISEETQFKNNMNSYYSGDFLKRIWILPSYPLYDNFKEGPDLPMPLAFHCAVAMPMNKGIFIFGGMKDSFQGSSFSYMYSFIKRKWTLVADYR